MQVAVGEVVTSLILSIVLTISLLVCVIRMKTIVIVIKNNNNYCSLLAHPKFSSKHFEKYAYACQELNEKIDSTLTSVRQI